MFREHSGNIHESKGLGLAGSDMSSGRISQIEHQFEGAIVVKHGVCINVHGEVTRSLAINVKVFGRGVKFNVGLIRFGIDLLTVFKHQLHRKWLCFQIMDLWLYGNG